MKYSRFIISTLTALIIAMFYVLNYKYQLSFRLVVDSDYEEYFGTGLSSLLKILVLQLSELITGFTLLYLFEVVYKEIKKNRIKCLPDNRSFCDKYFLHLYATFFFVGTVAWVTALTITDASFVQSSKELGIYLASVPTSIFSGAIAVANSIIHVILTLVYVVASLVCVVVFWMCVVQVINFIEFAHDKIEDYPEIIRIIKCVMCVSVIVIVFAVTLYFPLRIIFG